MDEYTQMPQSQVHLNEHDSLFNVGSWGVSKALTLHYPCLVELGPRELDGVAFSKDEVAFLFKMAFENLTIKWRVKNILGYALTTFRSHNYYKA